MKTEFLNCTMFLMLTSVQLLSAQRGYYDAPYKRYEADVATLGGGAVVTVKSYAQPDLQSEASDQVCVDMRSSNASAEFSFLEPADGLVLRYSVPDGESAVIGVYSDDIKIASITATSKWSWEYLWDNDDPNHIYISNKNPRMRFDEVRYKLPKKLSKIKLVKESGNLWFDFIEMEPVPAALTAPAGATVFSGDGSKLQAFINANGGKTIFIPAGVYNINSRIFIEVAKTKLMGAGMWFTQLNFTATNNSNGGLRANASDISYSDLYITTDMAKRTEGYPGILGVYTKGSTIKNIWVEHCGTGAWIAQYEQGGPAFPDGFLMSGCRFRNTYADGINLCKGTNNAIVEHCNFRNNGDDAMAIWCADGLECINNTFRNNTAENGWRAAGVALYGGKDNKFYDIIIKDNIDNGISISNLFNGVGFNESGLHDFHNITIIGCGTFNDPFNSRVGAIYINHSNGAGTKVQNIRLYNIDIADSKCDAIHIAKHVGDGIFNLSFENVTIKGTGKEYPFNNADNSGLKRGYAVFFDKYPLGGATYCSLNYSNLGGNADGVTFGNAAIGDFKWQKITGCEHASVTGVTLSPADTVIASGAIVKLVHVVSPSNATNKIVSYISANPEVATVSYDGVITGLSKGETTITVITQDGNFTATSKININSGPEYGYRIKNRWQNTYLYDAGDRVKYSATATGNAYLWKFENVDGVKEIRNLATGDYMHIENLLGYVQCTQRTSGTMSSRWSLEDVGSGFIRIKSEMKTTNYINIENLRLYAQYGTVASAWWSAMWLLDRAMLVTSASDIQLEKAAGIFPNPSNGEFNLSISEFAPNENVAVTIYNLTGQAVYTKTVNVNGNGFLNVKVNPGAILSSGNYYIVAKGNTNRARAKLLIAR